MRISVVYSTDENYARHACISMYSLFENNKEIDEIIVYIIDNNMLKASREKFTQVAEKYDRKVKFINCDYKSKKLKINERYPLAAYSRLYLEELIDEEKLLYLDCDTVINKSIKELWEKDISNYLIAGVQDDPKEYMRTIIGMDKKDRYINSGVLLINLKKWKNSNLKNKFVEFIEEFKGEVPHEDQGVINGVCKNDILIIEPKFNMMPQMISFDCNKIKKLANISEYYSQDEINVAINNPVIIHYIGKFYNRPWCEKCTHPYKDKYIKFMKKAYKKESLINSDIKKGVKIRKFIYYNMGFNSYLIIENILDLKRKYKLKKKYKFVKYKF